jgi:integrase
VFPPSGQTNPAKSAAAPAPVPGFELCLKYGTRPQTSVFSKTPSVSRIGAEDPAMTPLRRRMIEDMKLRNDAPRTIEIYVARVITFAKHFGKSPQLLGAADVRAYLLFLVQEKHASWSYYGQAMAALKLLYRMTLSKKWVVDDVVSPRQQKKLPVVLSPDEVTQFFEAIPGLKHRAILWNIFTLS